MTTTPSFSLSDLEVIIAERAGADASQSYTAKLIEKGVQKCAEKFGEEAVEAVIAGATEDRDGLKNEAADVLYHLLVLLKISGIPLNDVLSELERRTGQSGLEEKAARK